MVKRHRFLSVFLSILLLAEPLVGCGLMEKARSTTEQIVNWCSSIDFSNFKKGWDYAVKTAGASIAATLGSQYVQNVAAQISNFADDINASYGSARGIAQEAGFVAEKWVADTFNIDAAARGSTEAAGTAGSNKHASVDVATSYGENASLKYYQSASKTASAQAKTIIADYCDYCTRAKANGTAQPLSLPEYLDKNGYSAETTDLLAAVYSGQTRIIPVDQMDEAIEYLTGRINKLSQIEANTGNSLSAAYEDTLTSLKDRLRAPDGTTSRPATYEEMQAVAELGERGEFKPEDFGFTTSQIITPKFLLKQAIDAGSKAALLDAVLSVAPDIYSLICEAVRNGTIDEQQLKDIGIDGLLSASEGFVEGAAGCAIVSACQAGKLGSSLVNVSPEIVGTLTVILVDAIRYGYALAKKTITAAEYSNLMAEEIVIAATAQSSGALLALLLPAIPFAYLVGCLVGGMVGAVGYSFAKSLILGIKDGDGFAAIVPSGVLDTIDVAKDAVANLCITDRLTSMRDFTISTLKDGLIKIKASVT